MSATSSPGASIRSRDRVGQVHRDRCRIQARAERRHEAPDRAEKVADVCARGKRAPNPVALREIRERAEQEDLDLEPGHARLRHPVSFATSSAKSSRM